MSPEKIANRTVAEEYFAVTDKVDALYGQHTPLWHGSTFARPLVLRYSG